MEFLDLRLKLGCVHPFKCLQSLLGLIQLLLDGLVVHKGLFCRFDVTAILGEDLVDDLLGEGLVAHFEILQKFGFHGFSSFG